VAVKVFRLDLTPPQAAALVGELNAVVAADITHPNIASAIASGIEHGAPYLAQEYAIGDSLDAVLRERGPMAVRDVASLVEPLAAALDFAAERRIHHGLLHSRDIILSADGVRITGFGVFAALSAVGVKPPARSEYAPADVPSDVYSLGAIAFEALTGKPVSANSLKELETEHGSELRAVFEAPLAGGSQRRLRRAGDFANLLRAAAGLKASTTYGVSTTYAAMTLDAADTTDTPEAMPDAAAMTDIGAGPTFDAVTEPGNVTERFDVTERDVIGRDVSERNVSERDVVSTFRSAAPDAPLDDFEFRTHEPVDLSALPDEPIDRLIEPSSTTPISTSWVPQAPTRDGDMELEHSSRRWHIVAIFLLFAVVAALSVGFFLRSPRPTPATDEEPGVDATVVDLSASSPSLPNPSAGKPAPTAPVAPVGRRAPSPSPSRPASGAIRTAQTGSMLIRSTPAEADVLVNGKPRGKTPLALRDLALGSYTIRVAREGYAVEERTLQLTSGRPTTSTTIELRSTATRGASSSTIGTAVDSAAQKTGPGGLNVQSRPAGARVFVNDRLAGSTPIAIPALPAGPATVRIEMDGYQPWTTKVRVVAGEQARVAASLERK
jgi:hypothetical protein